MDRHRVPEDLTLPTVPAPGRAALLRHLRVVEDLDRTPPRTLRDASGGDDWEGRSLGRLARLLGGLDALLALDAVPLPSAEPFEFGAIDATDLPAVQSVVDALHQVRPPYIDAISRIRSHFTRYTPPWLHDEYVTIVHRLVARSARPGLPHWHRDPRRMAAAFVWLALGGNAALGRGREVSAQEIWRWYAVGDCRALARRLCVDTGIGSLYPPDDDRPTRDDRTSCSVTCECCIRRFALLWFESATFSSV